MKLIHRIYRAAIKNAVIIAAAVFPVVVQAIPTTEVKGFYFIGKSTNATFDDNNARDGADLPLSLPRIITEEQPVIITSPVSKTITLTNESGHTLQLKVSPRIHLTIRTLTTEYMDILYTAMRSEASCPIISSNGSTSRQFNFYFTERLNCKLQNNETVDSIALTYTQIFFTLKDSQIITPPVTEGTYRGTVNYSVGHGSDIDFGSSTEYNLSSIEMPIAVDVADMEHRVTFPPGSDRAELIPTGGWSHWINSGTRPESISREIPFTISSAGKVQVSLAECSYLSGTSCQIANDSGDLATLALNITLPEPWRRFVGEAPVTNLAITTRTTSANQVYTKYQVARNSPGKLKIEVKGAELDKMLAQPGSTWTGNVTVVFDKDAYD